MTRRNPKAEELTHALVLLGRSGHDHVIAAAVRGTREYTKRHCKRGRSGLGSVLVGLGLEDTQPGIVPSCVWEGCEVVVDAAPAGRRRAGAGRASASTGARSRAALGAGVQGGAKPGPTEEWQRQAGTPFLVDLAAVVYASRPDGRAPLRDVAALLRRGGRSATPFTAFAVSCALAPCLFGGCLHG